MLRQRQHGPGQAESSANLPWLAVIPSQQQHSIDPSAPLHRACSRQRVPARLVAQAKEGLQFTVSHFHLPALPEPEQQVGHRQGRTLVASLFAAASSCRVRGHAQVTSGFCGRLLQADATRPGCWRCVPGESPQQATTVEPTLGNVNALIGNQGLQILQPVGPFHGLEAIGSNG